MESTGMIAGFERRRLPGHGIEVDALVGGSGPPLLLLHGYPETRMCWAAVAPALTERHTVVVPDLRGYGRSDKPLGGGDHAAYSKRTMANDMVSAMKSSGFERFGLVGHDRGGRVAYRLALDHPERVSRLLVLDIVPTADVWNAMDAASAVEMFHWPFQAQDELPERLIGGDPEFFVRWTLKKQAAEGFEFPADSLADYLACVQDPATIHGFCEDYRAGWTIDRQLDEEDRGKRRIAIPTFVLWGEHGALAGKDPLSLWREWADDVRGHVVPGSGHFVPEEASETVSSEILAFME